MLTVLLTTKSALDTGLLVVVILLVGEAVDVAGAIVVAVVVLVEVAVVLFAIVASFTLVVAVAFAAVPFGTVLELAAAKVDDASLPASNSKLDWRKI